MRNQKRSEERKRRLPAKRPKKKGCSHKWIPKNLHEIQQSVNWIPESRIYNTYDFSECPVCKAWRVEHLSEKLGGIFVDPLEIPDLNENPI